MTNMEKICKIQLNRESDFNWQEVNCNNNREENNYPESKTSGSMKPKDLQLKNHELLGNYSENPEPSEVLSEVTSENFSRVALLSPNSNCSSANNSTDNLSYLSDGCLIEEVLLLQGNVSEEEISINSDDCVYAYRGADFDVPNQRVNPADDETDFLEMDFDPDPASEIDPINESNIKEVNLDCNYTNNGPMSSNKEMFELDTGTEGTQAIQCEPFGSDNRNKTQNGAKTNGGPAVKLTGAKPKKVSSLEKHSRNSKVTKYDGSESFDFVINTSREVPVEIKDTDEACLDCLEKEFLSETIGKELEPFQCTKCKCKICYDSYNHSTPYKLLDFDSANPSKGSKELMHYQRKSSPEVIRNENLLLTTKKETVSFLNIEADEKTIVMALEKMEVNFNRETIRNYFDGKQKAFKDVPEFILHMSKKNCDYKKVIKVIKAATTADIEIKFSPNDQAAVPTIQVNAFDILQYWTRKSDLGKLRTLGRKFSQMNVLGKIANLIRQAQQGNADVLNQVIAIPQYYETGYITINRK